MHNCPRSLQGRPRWPFTRVPKIEPFAVDATSAQITIRSRVSAATVCFDDQRVEVDLTEGAGAITISDLRPNEQTAVKVKYGDQVENLVVTTPVSTGPMRARFATISDLHLGLDGFGLVKHLRFDGEPGGMPYPYRCAEAAIDEAIAWGAELLIIKGDLTDKGATRQWRMVAELLGNLPIPVMVTPGNHDASSRAEVDAATAVQRLGLNADPVQVRDLDGVRICVADTTIAGSGHGSVRPITAAVIEAATTDTPVFLGVHHNIEHIPVPWFWPPGISSIDAKPLLSGLAAANPNVLISSGHSHRNRVHRLGPGGRIVATEVSSTSDYPAVWAGYEVSDTMIRQTVRRIARPDVYAWAETTRRAVGGVWPHWSQGRLDDRCVDLPLR